MSGGLLEPRPLNGAHGADRRQVELEIRGLTKVFHSNGGATLALDHVDLDIRRGEFVSIVGTSGCGKTTLLRIMAGLEGEYSGEARLEGKPITGPGIDKGVVFQDHRLLPWLTIEENIGFGLVNRKGSERDAIIREHLHLVGLGKFGKAYPGHLSGGMAQRAAIARALVNRPNILLLDEPLGALDALTRRHMQRELENIWVREKTTMVMVTHDIDEAIYLSDTIVLMSSRPGRIRKVIPVPLSRPRNREHPDFLAIERELLGAFELQAKDHFSYDI